MNNTQTENKQAEENQTNARESENAAGAETKTGCGCCGGKNKKQ